VIGQNRSPARSVSVRSARTWDPPSESAVLGRKRFASYVAGHRGELGERHGGAWQKTPET
jgi:hypothetical protein